MIPERIEGIYFQQLQNINGLKYYLLVDTRYFRSNIEEKDVYLPIRTRCYILRQAMGMA